jgi:polyribonucleotide nucleotidyltransferase
MKEDFTIKLGEKEFGVKINQLAEKANGSCMVRYGDTVVLATAVMGEEKKGQDFFPLTVEYQEKFYAAGKILGSRYMRRENRPSDEAILTSRLIDRVIRPRFPKGFKKEVQIIITCLSWDKENDADLPGLLATSLALGASDIPWSGPVAGLRVGKKDNEFILNPTYKERGESEIDLVFAVTESDSEILINMMESGAKEVKEDLISQSYSWMKPSFKKLIDFQKEIVKKEGKEKIEFIPAPKDEALEKEIDEFLKDKLKPAIYENKGMGAVDELEKELLKFIEEKFEEEEKIKYASNYFTEKLDRTMREEIVKAGEGKERRPDGRKIDEVREIKSQVGLLKRTHGSAIFQRGITKSLSIVTLGSPKDSKVMEGMEFIGEKRFMHHYNFPPYCAGETKPMRGPGRREIGHGMLAEKALLPLLPSEEEFPYTMRVVSEILSSNGSTSQASISSSSLALMDAGVPVKRLATGIAVGLITNPDKSVSQALKDNDYKLLTDIQGPEDHHGDMDFKVSGTREGITALQMDVKIEGINEKVLKEALQRAKDAREHILGIMEKTLSEPRKKLSSFAPRIYSLQINPEKIGDLIGPGGKVIREISEKNNVVVDVDDFGRVTITAEDEESAKKALSTVNDITREAKVGEIFQAKVKKITDFGAFVEFLPGQEGLVHISQIAPFHVNKVEDIIKLGDVVPVKVMSRDEQGRINLSIKEAKEELEKGNKK